MTARLSPEQVTQLIKGLSNWEVSGNSIKRKFEFESFMSAIEFVHRVAQLAEEADHHPDFLINYRRVTLTLSTHSEGGLTQKDFDLARTISDRT